MNFITQFNIDKLRNSKDAQMLFDSFTCFAYSLSKHEVLEQEIREKSKPAELLINILRYYFQLEEKIVKQYFSSTINPSSYDLSLISTCKALYSWIDEKINRDGIINSKFNHIGYSSLMLGCVQHDPDVNAIHLLQELTRLFKVF